jgi:triosephosphate isomerase
MAMRRPYVGGNWKMNLHAADATALAEAVAESAAPAKGVDVAIFPAFPYLTNVGRAVSDSPVKLGAQDCYHQPNGAFTGEVSLSMLQDSGVGVVLAGHSERRHVLGESDVLINAKLRSALEAELEVILCVGETLEQREAKQTNHIIAAQTCYGLAGVRREQMSQVTLAYEPVWAIGTGKTAKPQDAQEAHVAIRKTLMAMWGDDAAQAARIQYGGSVKPDNAADLIAQPDVDGFLVGGASLIAKDFLAIVEAATG